MLAILGRAHFLLVPLSVPSGGQLNWRLLPTAAAWGAGLAGQRHGGAFAALRPLSPSLESGPSAGQLPLPLQMRLPAGWLHHKAIPGPCHVFLKKI